MKREPAVVRWAKTLRITLAELPEEPVRDERAWERRLWLKVKTGNGCWLWIGALNEEGYGLIWWHYVLRSAHRVMFELAFGKITPNFVIDHLCRNHACVNPYHLDEVPSRVNIMRGEGLAAREALQTHCKRGHEFTPENTYRKPATPNKRDCRACKRLEKQISRATKRSK